jgi:carboxylate-amine ligase
MPTEDFTIGVEEEFGLVDPLTRELRPDIHEVLPDAESRVRGDEVSTELQQSQIEIGTPICRTLSEVRDELRRLRSRVAAAADAHGLAVLAAGSHPKANGPGRQITDKAAYEELGQRYAHLADEQLVFGCHVHVGVVDRELAIAAMGHLRPWLAPLLALTVSSPYWDGTDTGYASYRTEVFGRWPTAGPPELFRDRREFDDVVAQLLATGSIDDPARIYWDVRPSARFETLELRVADVCTSLDDAVLVAGLAGALVRTGVRLAEAGRPPSALRPELMRAARWRAARYGLSADLIDPEARRSAPAAAVIAQLLDFVAVALDEWGEREHVTELTETVLAAGTSAQRQREVYARRGSLDDVVDWILAETARA